MSGGPAAPGYRYREPPGDGLPGLRLAPVGGEGPGFRFFSRLELGRDDGAGEPAPGQLLVADPAVSRHHCILSQRPGGRCFVRDVSRNGTRLNGRRLVPNVETELPAGALLEVGERHAFRVEGLQATLELPESAAGMATVARVDRMVATVLVGDIQDYTVLVRTAPAEALQRAVARTFERLSAEVARLGGAMKEYQGDAILAYWGGDLGGRQAGEACRAALALDALAGRIAADPALWALPGFPLRMDWALSTGLVLIDSIGGKAPVGLSMMGEPVVRAFRIEKFASAETGRIVACAATRELAGPAFAFRDLGERTAKGFDRPDRIHALLGEA